MKKRDYCILFCTAFVITTIIAVIQKTPGYMDADYYYAGGVQLIKGNGFQDEFIWNYLNQPQGLPQPSNSYWMPLVSIIAWLGMHLSGMASFNGARIIFFVFACLISPLTAWFSYSLTHKRWAGIFSGIIALSPIFYSAYMVTTDNFAINMILGIVWFQLAYFLNLYTQENSPRYILLVLSFGITGGLLYLTRVDGILWVIIGGGYILYLLKSKAYGGGSRSIYSLLLEFGCYIGGVLVFVLPWLIRNYFAFDTLFPNGATKAIWFINYDDLYSYPAAKITYARWLQNGMINAISARLWALGQNIQTLIGVHGGIIFFPLVVAGLYKLRKDLRVRLGVIIWGIIFLLMTIIFPFAGTRGGFFHASAAVQPLFWAVTAVGLEHFISWGEKRRGWNKQQALPIFSVGIIVLALTVSFYIFHDRVIGKDWQLPVWNSSNQKYQKIEGELKRLGLSDEEVILINNPPGYWIANERSALSVPDGGVETLIELVNDFNVHYLVLEKDHPVGLNHLYSSPSKYANLERLSTVDDSHILLIFHE